MRITIQEEPEGQEAGRWDKVELATEEVPGGGIYRARYTFAKAGRYEIRAKIRTSPDDPAAPPLVVTTTRAATDSSASPSWLPMAGAAAVGVSVAMLAMMGVMMAAMIAVAAAVL